MYQKNFLTGIHLWLDRKRSTVSWLDFLLRKLGPVVKNPLVGKFLQNIGVVFLYNRFASLFITVIGIISARVLGPADFGNLALVGNASNFLIIPMMMGLNNAMFKFLPGSTPERKRELIGTALSGNILTALIFGLLYLNGYEWLGRPLRFSHYIWNLCIVYTIVINLFSIQESFLRGREEYAFIGKLRLVSSVVFFGSILMAYLAESLNLTTYFIFFFLSQILFVVLALWRNREWLKGFSRGAAQEIYRYGGIMMIHMLFNGVVFSSDIFIVNYFHPSVAVGIYSVYQGAVKSLFVTMFYEVFAVVFLPMIAQMDRLSIYKKINKMVWPIIIMVTLVTFGVTLFGVSLFGKAYPIRLDYAVLVALSISFYLLFQIYNSVISMEGKKEALYCLLPFVGVLPIALFLQVIMTKTWGLTGAMIAVLMTNILLFIAARVLIRLNIKSFRCQ